MKKALLSLAVVAASATAASAQASHAVKVNFISPFLRTGSFFYEHKLSDNGTGQLGVAYTGANIFDSKLRGVTIIPEYRFYLSGEAMDGFYIGPFLRFRSFKVSSEYEETTYNSGTNTYNTVTREASGTWNNFGGGAVFGRQWLFRDRFTLDLFIGPSYGAGSVKADSGSDEDNIDIGNLGGFGVRSGATFGIAF